MRHIIIRETAVPVIIGWKRGMTGDMSIISLWFSLRVIGPQPSVRELDGIRSPKVDKSQLRGKEPNHVKARMAHEGMTKRKGIGGIKSQDTD